MALLLGTMIRVKTQSNGFYVFLTEQEFAARDRAAFIEVYSFADCRVDDEGMTGLNAAGQRVTLDEG